MLQTERLINLGSRVIAALNHEETGNIPVQLEFESSEMENAVLRHFDVADLGDIGLKCIYHGKPVEPVSPMSDDMYIDMYGSTWQSGKVKHVVTLALREPCLKEYSFPDYGDSGLHPGIGDSRKNAGGKFVLWNVLRYGLFERAWSMTGMEDLLVYMHTDPEFVQNLIAGIQENAMASIQSILAADVDALNCGPGDAGSQQSLLMSPESWRRFFYQPWKEQIDLIHSAGRMVYCHSCGNNTQIMDDYISIGVDIYDPLQPECMDIRTIKRRYGDYITFRGAIDTQQLPYTDPAAIRDNVRETVDIMAVGGGYIAAPAKPIPDDTPMQNVLALAETLLEYAGPMYDAGCVLKPSDRGNS